MEWESDRPCHSHTYPGQECWSSGRCSSWELEFRDYGAISGKGCHWLQRNTLRGCEGEDWGKMTVEKAWQPWQQGDASESHVECGAITIASLSPQASIWTIERLAHQRPDALNYRVGPHPGCSFKWLMWRSMAHLQSTTPARGPFYVPDAPNNREGSQAREPSKCLNG